MPSGHVLSRRLQELVLPSTLHTVQEKPLVLGAHSTSQSQCRVAPAAGVSVAVNGNLGKSGVAFALALVTGVMQTPDCASLIIYSVTQDELTGKQGILQGQGGSRSSLL